MKPKEEVFGLKLHLDNVFLAEELEQYGIDRKILMQRLKTEKVKSPWKQERNWVILSRAAVKELYPLIQIPDDDNDYGGFVDLAFGCQWDDFMPFSVVKKNG